MSLFTITTSDGGLVEVLSGDIAIEDMGTWIAHIEIGEDEAPTGAVTINVARDDGGDPATFHGTIIDPQPAYEGRARLVIVGGAGGLLGASTFDDYHAAPTAVSLYDLVHEILAAAGERETEGLADELDGLSVDRWTRAVDETWGKALTRAVESQGLTWRVLDSGVVWVGAEAWPEAELDGRELDLNTDMMRVDIGFDAATARPGTTIGGRRIRRVVLTTEGRGALYYGTSEREDFTRALRAVQEPDPYSLIHCAEVVIQRGDGTLDLLILDGPFRGEILAAPFEPGLECSQTIPPKARVRVAFAGGKPGGAFAFGRTFNGAADKPAARVGDTAEIGYLTGLANLTTGVVTLALSPVFVPNSIHLTAEINSGSLILRIP